MLKHLKTLNPALESELDHLQHRLGHQFQSQTLILEALTHRSATGPIKQLSGSKVGDYEKLEFLGDAVIDLILSEDMLKAYSEKSVGSLSKARASIVNEEALARIAQSLQLQKLIVTGPGEQSHKPSIMADVLEAICGALFLDAGVEATKAIVLKLFRSDLQNLQVHLADYDPKSELQELTQQNQKTPEYKLLSTHGPDHDRMFSVGVYLDNKMICTADARSKKAATKLAAKKALTKLRESEVSQ